MKSGSLYGKMFMHGEVQEEGYERFNASKKIFFESKGNKKKGESTTGRDEGARGRKEKHGYISVGQWEQMTSAFHGLRSLELGYV